MKVSAQVVLLNEQGYVLGVSRKTDHNDFGLAGGKMDPEDDGNPETTAIRETREETGLKISNLKLIFAIHKDGFMSYTYLADYEGEINHNEPHVVKWLAFERLVNGSFGKYNKLVTESLNDIGIKYVYETALDEVTKEVKNYIESTPINGEFYELNSLTRTWYERDNSLVICFKNDDNLIEEIDERKCKEFQKGLDEIGIKYGFVIFLNDAYYIEDK